MKILIDMNLSPEWVAALEAHGFPSRHWVTVGARNAPDTDVLNWARDHSHIVLTHPSLSTALVLQRLLHQTDPARDTTRARSAFEAYDRSNILRCAWTNEPIRRMHVDHAILWSLWRSNDLWNLLPVESRVKTEKGTRLPSRRRVEARRDSIIASWEILFEAERAIFLTHARRFAGGSAGTDIGVGMQDLLFWRVQGCARVHGGEPGGGAVVGAVF